MKEKTLCSLTALLFLVGCSTANNSIHSESMFEKHQRCGFQKSGNRAIEYNGTIVVIHDPKFVDKDCQ
jgi:hypothetical protein